MTIWVKLDVDFWDHPKVVRAGPRAAALYLAGLMWAQKQLADGEIPKELVPQLALKVGVKPAEAKALVRERLWHEAGGSFVINDWQDWLRTRAEVERERVENRRRVAAWREKKRAEKAASNGRVTPLQRR